MKTLVLLFLACILFSYPALAARGFGTTYGTAATDLVEGGYTTGLSTTISIAVWEYSNGANGSTDRIFDQYNSAAVGSRLSLYGANTFQVPFTTNNGQWTVTAPTTAKWQSFVITYNGGSTSNVPVIYVNGVSQTVTTLTAPTGTVKTLTGNWYIGNREDAGRGWNGKIAELAVWNGVILTANEAKALGTGASPLTIRTGSLSFYMPLYGTQSGEPDWGPNDSSQTVTGAKSQPHPAAMRMSPMPSAMQ